MPRSVPQPGWERHPEDQSPPFSDDDLSEIIQTIEPRIRTPDEAVRAGIATELHEIAKRYRVACHQHGMPTNGQVCAALRELNQKAKSLAHVISNLDDLTVEALLQQRGYFRDLGRETPDSSFEARRVRQGSDPIAILAEEAEAAANWVEERTNNPDGTFDPKLLGFEMPPFFDSNLVPIKILIKKLASLYVEATGQEPRADHDRARDAYGGPFFEFVSAFLQPLGDARTNQGLGRTIQNALTDRRRIWTAIAGENIGTN